MNFHLIYKIDEFSHEVCKVFFMEPNRYGSNCIHDTEYKEITKLMHYYLMGICVVCLIFSTKLNNDIKIMSRKCCLQSQAFLVIKISENQCKVYNYFYEPLRPMSTSFNTVIAVNWFFFIWSKTVNWFSDIYLLQEKLEIALPRQVRF